MLGIRNNSIASFPGRFFSRERRINGREKKRPGIKLLIVSGWNSLKTSEFLSESAPKVYVKYTDSVKVTVITTNLVTNN